MKMREWPYEYVAPKTTASGKQFNDEEQVNIWCKKCTGLDAITLFLFIQVDSSVFAFFGGIATNFFAAALITLATQEIDFTTTKSILLFGIAVIDFFVQMILIGLILKYTLYHIRISKKNSMIISNKDISDTMKRYKQISTCLPVMNVGKASVVGIIILLIVFIILKSGTFCITNCS